MSYLGQYDLASRVAVVTGAGGGIGEECALALAEAGALVHCVDVNLAQAERVAARLADVGTPGKAHQLDVTDTAQVDALADELADTAILVGCAGIVTNTPSEDMPDEEWNKVIGVNLTGIFKTCRAFGRKMLARGSGSIVNIGSMSGLIVNTPQPQCHYNASKAGVHQLTRSMAVEWAKRGVRVNAVAPTYIATPLVAKFDQDMVRHWMERTPMGRMGKPSEVASAVLFLASDASSLMTGTVLTVDAGFTAV